MTPIEPGWLRRLRRTATGDVRQLLALYDAAIRPAVTLRTAEAPHLEVRMQWVPLATIARPWSQTTHLGAPVWSHTGILFQAPTIGTQATAEPPHGYGYGLLQAYLDGQPIDLSTLDAELLRLGIRPESIEGLF